MGLDFSHTDAHWAYSGFMRFRTRIAATLGINLESMEGFARDLRPNQSPVPWDTVDDDIKILLYHSDCDGDLSPDECRKIAPRLREIVSPWPDDHDKQQALLLADGMDRAAKKKEALRFC